MTNSNWPTEDKLTIRWLIDHMPFKIWFALSVFITGAFTVGFSIGAKPGIIKLISQIGAGTELEAQFETKKASLLSAIEESRELVKKLEIDLGVKNEEVQKVAILSSQKDQLQNELEKTQIALTNFKNNEQVIIKLNDKFNIVNDNHKTAIEKLKKCEADFMKHKQDSQDRSKIIPEVNGINFDPSKQPFALRLDRTVLLCDDLFSIAYTGYKDNLNKYQIKINGRKNDERPGNQFFGRVKNDGGKLTQLTVRFLEYLRSEDATLVSYTCRNLR